MKDNVLLQKISFDLLDRLIDKYELETGDAPKYIVMNRWTGSQMVLDAKRTFTFVRECSMYSSYKGIDIAFCDKLQNGEIEVV